MKTVRTLIKKELRDAKSNKWLYFYAGIIGVLGAVIAFTGIQQGGSLSLQVFGRTTATLVNLCLFLAPLVALTLGSGAITGEKDQGTLEQLLSQPVTFTEILLGKYLGLWIALFVATLAGFAPAGILIGLFAPLSDALRFLLYPVLSQLLISVMLSIGLLISVCTKSRAQSQTVAIAVWFITVLAYDIIFIGSLSIISLSANTLAMTLIANPVDAARIFAVLTLEPDMYILGPSGAYMIDTFSTVGTGVLLLSSLLLWTILPFAAAKRIFSGRLLYPGRKRTYGQFAFRSAAIALLACTMISCGGKKEEGSESNEAQETESSAAPAEDDYHADVANLAKGTELYMMNCSPCHGKTGKGDGPAAANLNPKPRDHSNGEYMNKLTDKHIGNVIKKGGGIAGFPTMPAHPHLKTDDINAVIAFVRTLGKKP